MTLFNIRSNVKSFCNFFNIFSFWFLIVGSEYALILSSVKEYLESFSSRNESLYSNQTPSTNGSLDKEGHYNGGTDFGWALAAFSVAELLSSPIYGRITDKTGSIRNILLVSLVLIISGNLSYTFATSPLIVIVSRFLSGLGVGAQATMYGTVARYSTEKELSGEITKLTIFRHVGLVIGPLCIQLFQNLNFTIGTCVVDKLSFLGIFMALTWTAYSVIFFFCFDEIKYKLRRVAVDPPVTDKLCPNRVQKSLWKTIGRDLIRPEVMTCLLATFSSAFVQAMIETLITPLTDRLLGWRSRENSYLLTSVGILIITASFVLMKMTSFTSDRKLLLGGFVLTLLENLALLIFLHFSEGKKTGETWVLVVFLVVTTFFVTTIPFSYVPQNSLLSKITTKETTAFTQGIRNSVKGIAQVIAPLWTMYNISNNLMLTSLGIILSFISMISIILTFKKLTTKVRHTIMT